MTRLGVKQVLKLDYTIEDPQERNELVQKIIAETPDINDRYLEILGDYLMNGIEKQDRKDKRIKALSENHAVTISKHETSLEGLVASLENGEDGIYNLITENNKSIIFQPKVKITKQDLEDIPYLKQIRESIARWEEQLKVAEGRDKYIIKQAIIDLRKDQYLIRNCYKPPIICKNLTRSTFPKVHPEWYDFDEEGYVIPHGVSLCDPKVCSAILCYYNKLKDSAYGRFDSDLWATMHDFDTLLEVALADYPLYKTIVELKIDGAQNVDIQEILVEKYGIKHSLEYISSLWRNKIPGLLASQAEDNFLDTYYLSEAKGKYKKCSRCGEIKLAHNKYFSKNKTSKDGFYSICKSCRNKKSPPKDKKLQ